MGRGQRATGRGRAPPALPAIGGRRRSREGFQGPAAGWPAGPSASRPVVLPPAEAPGGTRCGPRRSRRESGGRAGVWNGCGGADRQRGCLPGPLASAVTSLRSAFPYCLVKPISSKRPKSSSSLEKTRFRSSAAGTGCVFSRGTSRLWVKHRHRFRATAELNV